MKFQFFNVLFIIFPNFYSFYNAYLYLIFFACDEYPLCYQYNVFVRIQTNHLLGKYNPSMTNF